MSTGIGTLQKARSRSLWPAAVVLSFVMLTVAVIVISIDGGRRETQAPPKGSEIEAPSAVVVGGTAANTPSELRGPITARAGKNAFRGHDARDGIGASAGNPADALGTNTPTEISGGMKTSQAEIWAREHMRRP